MSKNSQLVKGDQLDPRQFMKQFKQGDRYYCTGTKDTHLIFIYSLEENVYNLRVEKAFMTQKEKFKKGGNVNESYYHKM